MNPKPNSTRVRAIAAASTGRAACLLLALCLLGSPVGASEVQNPGADGDPDVEKMARCFSLITEIRNHVYALEQVNQGSEDNWNELQENGKHPKDWQRKQEELNEKWKQESAGYDGARGEYLAKGCDRADLPAKPKRKQPWLKKRGSGS